MAGRAIGYSVDRVVLQLISSGGEQSERLTREAKRYSTTKLARAVFVAGVILLALYLRWDRLWNAEFNYDQAWSLNRAYDFLFHGDFPFFGEISSRGVPHGPVEIYLLTIPLLISRDPVIATAFVGLLQTIAVLLTFFLGARYFDWRVGTVASFLYAVNPWAITFGRKLWPPSMMPVLAAACLFALFESVVNRRPRWFIAAGGLASALAMTHPAGFVVFPVLAIVVALYWRRLGFAVVALAVVAAVAVASPYLWYDSQQGFAFLLGYWAVPGAAAASLDLSSLRLAFDMASENGLRQTLGAGSGGSLLLLPALDIVVWLLLTAGVLVSLVRALVRSTAGFAGGERPAYSLALLWFLVPVLLTVRHAMELNAAYFVSLWPVQFLFMGVSAVAAVDFVRKRFVLNPSSRLAGGALVAIVLGIIGLSQTMYVRASVDRTVSSVQTGEWGVPLSLSKQAISRATELRQRLADAPVMVYASNNQWTALNYLSRPDLHLEKVEPPQSLVLPGDLSRGAILMVAANDAAAEPLGFDSLADASPVLSAAHDLGFTDLPDASIGSDGGRAYFRFLYLEPSEAERTLNAFGRQGASLSLPNGLDLEGVRFTSAVSAGGTGALSVLWRMPADPAQYPWQDYVLFAHLVDGTGKAVAKYDWPVFQYRLLWRAGDYLVGEYELPIPAEAQHGLLWLDIGAYEYYSRGNVSWLDGNGIRTGEAAKFGPLKVRGSAVPGPSIALTATFGDLLALDGYDLRAGTGVNESTVTVSLHWRAMKRPETDYTVSIQVLDAAGKLVGQHDSPPRNGALPTSALDAGERVLDTHDVGIKSPGPLPYRIAVVVYDAQSGKRLRVGDADFLELTTFR